MKKKNGFTLAEVLIALTIVGIVAAISVPILMTAREKQVYAASLSAAVSTFENAMNIMIMKDAANNLLDTSAFKYVAENGNKLDKETSESTVEEFMDDVGETLKFKKYVMGETGLYGASPALKYLDGTPLESELMDGPIFLASSGAAFCVIINDATEGIAASGYETEREMVAAGTNLLKGAGYVYIDVNSEKTPNKIGRDVFKFLLGVNGKLYPCGGEDYSKFTTGEYNDTWETGSDGYDCTDKGLGCAARVMESGYKMDY